MAKKTRKSAGRKRTPPTRKAGAGRGATATVPGGKRKAAGAKTPKGKARHKLATSPSRPGKLKSAARKQPAGRAAAKPASRSSRRPGGTGREETLAQTPEAGRTTRGRTNPMPTRRSTGTGAGAGSSRSSEFQRDRKMLREVEESVPTPPSSLDMDRSPSAARSGRQKLQDAREDHNETSPAMTGGDVDADWKDAYSVGDEAPGGDNPTPDQDRVDDIGKALGVTYEDSEELKASDKIADRDRHRWELDPASSEDYRDRD